jgi:hypothetical protein
LHASLYDLHIQRLSNNDEELSADLGMEIHALSAAAKPLCAWIARDAIQDCRESCGGHGYLKSKYKIIIVCVILCVCICIYMFFYNKLLLF